MTRKHFVAIAAAMKELRENGVSVGDVDNVDQASRAIADVCAEINSRFDRTRFLRACQ